ncbi:MAG: NAD-dependent epimerase/dehydratase family protein [Candidatus Heimdallarchaeota archaeon]|nr:NAD-dependent epimerase/dehydratase family protein [Candidatus Heimdallarchaeota archaeon]
MNILITGAFGQLGSKIIERLINSNHSICCFDVKNRRTKRKARKFKRKVNILWGDIRNENAVRKAVVNQDLIIHLAFHLPPITQANESSARAINVGGTKNLLAVAKQQTNKPKFLFASSVVIYGDVRDKQQPINPDKEPQPVDCYAKQKVECMHLIKNSGLDYSIFVLGVVPPVTNLAPDPTIFEIPFDTKVELLHEDDAAQAFANAVSNEQIWNQVLHIAGGPSCRLQYGEFIQRTMSVMGIGSLPEKAFGGANYHCCLLSSEKSQAILDYQKHSFEDILSDMENQNKFLIFLIKIFRPLVRRFFLKQSPYF